MRISDWSSDVCSSDLAAVGIALDELIKRFVGFAQAFRVALAGVLTGELGKRGAGGRKGNQALQVQHVVGAWVVGVLLLETVDGEIGSASCRERVCLYV